MLSSDSCCVGAVLLACGIAAACAGCVKGEVLLRESGSQPIGTLVLELAGAALSLLLVE